ncbi:50S ribosomal protein 5, chloroplastic [Camellia sinensis]|uniref:Uncharacterized protein n=1 Tax=Camellia sinensis var. sinensis TaxID=542762 RepID=A0A4S4ELA2_CAMSN|nr:50S ribosomal protein 5, chloroplastic [Camellia sinensis]THG16786.1 hypothetical protein TEA_015974 [Camellia sinensis var. sinensis]
MTLLFIHTPSLSSLSSPSPSPTSSFLSASNFPITANPFFRLRKELIDSRPKLCNVRKERVVSVIVKASSDVDGVAEPPSPSEGEEQAAAVPVENLPLESKLQLDLEKKMKFKLAKKIRLRRKKLVWKRRMRKRGRWPPSKLKKSKNV